jgi:hypothetical protein
MTRENAHCCGTRRLADNLANAVIGAYEVAIMRGTRAADKAQYFRQPAHLA